MIQFIDRQEELVFLNRKFESSEAELLIFYGRRRIGKTMLLTQFSKSKKCLYFLGRLESREDTIQRLNTLFIDFFQDTSLLNYRIEKWDVGWDYLAQNASERLLFIIDEFPFLVERFPELISILQEKWDSLLKNTQLMLILSGSSISMMEKYAIDYHSPLYGRWTGQWKVDKIPILFLHDFFPSYSVEELIKTYSSIDLIPGYLTKFNPKLTPDENLKQKILTKGEYLYEEVYILLREEFRDPSNYISILAGIAGGLTSFGDIANHTHLEKSLLSKYLATLEMVNFIEKIQPVLSPYKSTLKGKGLYRIKDNYIDFWFRFLFTHQSILERGLNPAFLEDTRILHQYFSYKFENFCAELLPFLDISDFNQIGRWWYKDIEIDICAVNEAKNILFLGECKWSNQVNTMEIVNALNNKADAIPWKKNQRILIFGIFAQTIEKKINNLGEHRVICVDFKDMTKILIEKKTYH